jgi:hypothetical protein
MAVNFCANCGTPLPGDAAFCGTCGAAIARTAIAVEPAPDPTTPVQESPVADLPPKVGFHWGYAGAALVIALIGFVATANGDTARLVGFAMIAMVGVGALVSGGYRHMGELSGLPAFIAKLPGYCFIGAAIVLTRALSNNVKHRSERE